MAFAAEQCASDLLDTIPLVMRAIRSHMRSCRRPELSVPAFRALLFLQMHPDESMSELAEFIGLALPSISKLVDGLVGRELATRQGDPKDRRRVTLALTPQGRALLERTRQSAQACLAEVLAQRSEAERVVIGQALQILRPAFTPLPKPNHGKLEKKVLR